MKKTRNEDRRSCHNVSLILSLAHAGQHPDRAFVVQQLFATMLNLVTPMRGQAPN